MKKLMAVLLSMMMLCACAVPAVAENSVKDETVYILANPDGTARKVIVSDWLSNPDALSTLTDASTLDTLQNVKGDETFNGSVWHAMGQDIYYQGTSDAPLPVTMRITYTLDGEEIAPADLAGRSGHVVIRFDYTVDDTVSALINGVEEQLTVPYVVITSALLENDVFTNVAATNARIVNDGDRTLMLGAALPGLQQSLALDADTLELPAYVQLEADVTAFALPVILSIATSEPFALLDGDKLSDTSALDDAMEESTTGMAQLLDGSRQLYDGTVDLASATDLLSSGVSELAGGLSTLESSNETLIAGSTQVFNTLLATANQQLAAAGADIPALTIDTYADTLSTLIGSMSEEGITQQARAQVEEAVRAQDGQIRAAVTQAVQQQVQAQVEAAVQENVLAQVLSPLNMTAEDYTAARENGLLPAEQEAQVTQAVQQLMASPDVQTLIQQQTAEQLTSEEVLTLIDQQTEAQILQLIDQQMASDGVQTKIARSLQQYQTTCATLTALKEQLDSYNTFHTGLITYTQGVASASAGAAKLNGSMPALKEGVAALEDGAWQLCDGLTTFNTDGIDKLTRLVEDDLDELLTRARALIRAADDAQNYSGIADDTDGKLRFIWRTDAIEP